MAAYQGDKDTWCAGSPGTSFLQSHLALPDEPHEGKAPVFQGGHEDGYMGSIKGYPKGSDATSSSGVP